MQKTPTLFIQLLAFAKAAVTSKARQTIKHYYGSQIDRYFQHHSIGLHKRVYRAMEEDKGIATVDAAVDEYETICLDHSRDGRGIDPHCRDVGLEDPSTVGRGVGQGVKSAVSNGTGSEGKVFSAV